MLVEYPLNRVGEQLDHSTGARPFGREQDQAGVRLAAGEAFGGNRPGVLHVVRDDDSVLARGDF
jgi:hypothetical protein